MGCRASAPRGHDTAAAQNQSSTPEVAQLHRQHNGLIAPSTSGVQQRPSVTDVAPPAPGHARVYVHHGCCSQRALELGAFASLQPGWVALCDCCDCTEVDADAGGANSGAAGIGESGIDTGTETGFDRPVGDGSAQPNPSDTVCPWLTPQRSVVAVSLGYAHAAMLLANGDVYTWGSSRSGALGHGEVEQQLAL